MPRSPSPMRLVAALALAAAASGCLPKIGDGCSSSLDCSQRGERLCDNTQPDGYCTIYNCEPDSCPDSATCVAFNHVLDPACGTTSDGAQPRFERTFCVAPCNDKDDCRPGYDCIEMATLSTPELIAQRRGLVLDTENPRNKVCLVELPASDDGSTMTGLPPVCEPSDGGSLPDPYVPPEPPGSGGAAGGEAGGADGASGAGGAGNAGSGGM